MTVIESGAHIKFRNDDETLTLWVEKVYESDGYVVGWCPERENPYVVAVSNIVTEDVPA